MGGSRWGRTIQSSLFPEEADFAFGIASDETDDHGFLFAPLEAIHTSKLETRKCLLQRSQHTQLEIFLIRCFLGVVVCSTQDDLPARCMVSQLQYRRA